MRKSEKEGESMKNDMVWDGMRNEKYPKMKLFSLQLFHNCLKNPYNYHHEGNNGQINWLLIILLTSFKLLIFNGTFD